MRPMRAVERIERALVATGHVGRDRHPLQVGGREPGRGLRAGEERVRLCPRVPPEGLVGAREIVGVNDFSFPGPVAVYVVVEDPDALHDRAVAAGVEIIRGLEDQPYGSRDFAARDHHGNVWSFGTYRPPA